MTPDSSATDLKADEAVLVGMRLYRWLASPVATACVRLGVSPNVVTTASLMSGAAAGFALLTESFAVAALLLQVMVVLDFADGMVARRTSTSTYFGFVYDFVGDRLKIAWFLSCVSAVTPGVLALAWVALLLLVLSDGLSVGLLPRSSGRTPVRSFHGVRAVARIVAANLVRFDMHIIGLAGVFLLLGARGGQITLVILVGSLALNLGRVVAGRWEWDPLGGRHGFHPRSGIWQKFWNRLR